MLTLAVAALLATGPTSTGRPVVTGALQPGSKLTATAGTWVGTSALGYAYQWYRCGPNGGKCSSIRGATRSTYTLVAKDTGHTLGLTVRATDSSGTTSAYASLAGVVAASAGATRQPVLTGDAIVGRTLTAPAVATWKRCNPNGRACATIAHAAGTTYAPVARDVGHALVAVTAHVWSIATEPVRAAPGPLSLTAPSVDGRLQQGKQLRASAGTWSGSGTVQYAYQWYRCDPAGAKCSAIRGATKATYTLVAKDAGATVGLTVRATDAAGTTTAYAPLAGLVAAASAKLVATSQPTVERTTGLKVVPGTWAGSPTAFSYAWLRCNANGRLCTTIAGAATDEYTPVAADEQHTIVAAVTAAARTGRQTVLTTAVSAAS
jgi:hypothetical protein